MIVKVFIKREIKTGKPMKAKWSSTWRSPPSMRYMF